MPATLLPLGFIGTIAITLAAMPAEAADFPSAAKFSLTYTFTTSTPGRRSMSAAVAISP